MKLVNLVNAIDNLQKLSDMLLPAKESFKVVRLLTEIEPQVQNYHLQRNKLLSKYGDSEDEITFTIREEEKESYMKEAIDLENIEVNLHFEKIKISENLAIKASDLVNIIDFIEIVD